MKTQLKLYFIRSSLIINGSTTITNLRELIQRASGLQTSIQMLMTSNGVQLKADETIDNILQKLEITEDVLAYLLVSIIH